MSPMLQRLRDFLGLRRSIVGLLGVVICVGLGEKVAERFLPIYLLALHGGPLAVGLLGAVKNFVGALYSFFGGYLTERLGIKRSLLLFNLISAAGFLTVAVAPSWPAVIGAAVLYLSWSAISLPATMGLVGQALPSHKRTMGVTMHSLVRRLPAGVGPILGGVLIDRLGEVQGVRAAMLIALAMCAVAVIVQQRLIPDDRHTARPPATAESNPWRALRHLNPSLRNLLVSDVLIRFCEQIPEAFVVVWCMKTIAAPVSGEQFGVLTAIEMATAALVYIPVAHLADRFAKKPFVLITFGFFAAFPLVLLYAHSFWPLVAAFVVRGLKEFGDATRKALILDLAPAERRAATFGVYYLVRDSIVALAAFGGMALWQISPRANLLTAFGFGVAGAIWFALFGRDAPRAAPAAER